MIQSKEGHPQSLTSFTRAASSLLYFLLYTALVSLTLIASALKSPQHPPPKYKYSSKRNDLNEQSTLSEQNGINENNDQIEQLGLVGARGGINARLGAVLHRVLHHKMPQGHMAPSKKGEAAAVNVELMMVVTKAGIHALDRWTGSARNIKH